MSNRFNQFTSNSYINKSSLLSSPRSYVNTHHYNTSLSSTPMNVVSPYSLNDGNTQSHTFPNNHLFSNETKHLQRNLSSNGMRVDSHVVQSQISRPRYPSSHFVNRNLNSARPSQQVHQDNLQDIATPHLLHSYSSQQQQLSFNQVKTQLDLSQQNRQTIQNNTLSAYQSKEQPSNNNYSYTERRHISSSQTMSRENNYRSEQKHKRNDEMSPSKRVTFDLAQNTYTNIDEIERRLSESTRLRPADDDDQEDGQTQINTVKGFTYNNDVDINKRYSREKFGLNNYQFKAASFSDIPSESMMKSFVSSTPKKVKMMRSPSRSKSPIKSSLKNTAKKEYAVDQRKFQTPFQSQIPQSIKESPQSIKVSPQSIKEFSQSIKESSQSIKESSQLIHDRDELKSSQMKNEKGSEKKDAVGCIQGYVKYADGSRYDGTIQNGQRHGYGTLLSGEFQVIYQGEWENDTFCGKGKFLNLSGENLCEDYDYKNFDEALRSYWESFEGEFQSGKLHGFGTFTLTNGEKLVGNFKNGRISGRGTFYCTKGPAIVGNWDNNKLTDKY